VAGNCLDFLDVNSSDLQSREGSSWKSVFTEIISKGVNRASVPSEGSLV